jgi:hypothetical protein
MVTYTITAANTGTLQLHNVSFSIPSVTSLECTSSDGAPFNTSVVLALDAVVVCTGRYTFSQDDIEAPPKVVAATAACSTNVGARAFTSNDASVTALNTPSMSVDIRTAECIRPTRAREL